MKIFNPFLKEKKHIKRHQPIKLSEKEYKESLRALNTVVSGVLNTRVDTNDIDKYKKLIEPLKTFSIGFDMLKGKL
jgi:hypothetical protein